MNYILGDPHSYWVCSKCFAVLVDEEEEPLDEAFPPEGI
jgi:hypothetical protein